MPSAFITGARGFLGGHITRQLLDAGWEVTALLRPGSVAHDGSSQARTEPLRRAKFHYGTANHPSYPMTRHGPVRRAPVES